MYLNLSYPMKLFLNKAYYTTIKFRTKFFRAFFLSLVSFAIPAQGADPNQKPTYTTSRDSSVGNNYNHNDTYANGETATIKQGVAIDLAPNRIFRLNTGSTVVFEINGTQGSVDTRMFALDDFSNVNGSEIIIEPGVTFIARIVGAVPAVGKQFFVLSGPMSSPGGLNPAINIKIEGAPTLRAQTSFTYAGDSTGGVNFTIQSIILSATSINPSSTVKLANTFITSYNSQIIYVQGNKSCSSVTPFSFASDLSHLVSNQFASVAKKQRGPHVSRFSHVQPLPGLKPKGEEMNNLIDKDQIPNVILTSPNMPIRAWMNGIYSSQRDNSSSQLSTTKSHGVQMGIDGLQSVPVGLSLSIIRARPAINKISTGQTNSIQFGLYGNKSLGNLNIISTASYLNIRNNIRRITTQKFTTKGLNLFGSAIYNYVFRKNHSLEPFLALTYTRLWTPTIREYVSNILSSTTKSRRDNTLSSDIGVRLSRFFGTETPKQTPIKLFIQASWSHNYKSKLKGSRIIFAADSSVTNLPSQAQQKNALNVGSGLVVRRGSVDISANYSGSFAPNFQNHTGVISFRTQF